MVRGQGSVVLVALVMAIAIGGCAMTPEETQPSAAPGAYGGREGSAGSYDGTGTLAQSPARPRLGDFIVNHDVRDIHFAFDSYEIRSSDAKILDATTQWLRTHPDALLLIEGHADERGTNEYNVALGERRAKASMNYLVSHGIQAARITIISYGEERGTCHESNERCWSLNRRAHFLVKSH